MSGNRSKSAFFEGGWVTLSADFREKRASLTNHCWCQKTRVIAVSCGIKIFAVRCLALSQYTHLTDGQTDGQTQNSDSNTVRCITCSRTVKMINEIKQKLTTVAKIADNNKNILKINVAESTDKERQADFPQSTT